MCIEQGVFFMANMTRGDQIVRIILAVILIFSIFLPFGSYLVWLVVAVLVITGVSGYCPLYGIVKK